jgi:GAF domain-containing protein
MTNATWNAPWDDDAITTVIASATAAQHATTINIAQTNGEVIAKTMIVHGIPIRWQNHVWGVLEFRTVENDTLAPTDRLTIDAIAPLLAAEINHAIAAIPDEHIQPDDQAILTFSKHLDLARLLSRLRQDFDPPLPLHSLLPLVLSRGIDYTGAEAGSIVYVDHDRQEIELVATHGYTITQLPDISGEHKRHRWSWESGIAGKVARSARSLLIREVTQDVDYFYQTKPEIRAKIAIPITVDGRAEAVLILDSTRANAFGNNESAMALGVARAAVQPLRQALRYQEMLERSTQLSQVFNSIPSGLILIDRHGQSSATIQRFC